MNNAVLLLGTNLGNKALALTTACNLIEKSISNILKKSKVYETEPWGNKDQASFLNQVITIAVSCNANALLQELLRIEEEMGRKRIQKWEPRLIDIDILFFNNEIIDTEVLTVPHPLMKVRRFALVPLNEIMANFLHPVYKCPVHKLLTECADEQQVKLYI